MRSLAFAVLSAALAAPLLAQQPLAETIEVRVVNLDVIVTDRSGDRVHGLTRDDFEVLENGKPQTITNFYEITPGDVQVSVAAAPAAAATTTNPPFAPVTSAATIAPEDIRARRFVFCLDNYSMEPGQRNSVLKALRKFIDKEFKPGDEGSLIIWQRKIDIITPLTSDKDELYRGLDTVVGRSRAGMSASVEELEAKRRCQDFFDMVDGTTMTYDSAWLQCEGSVKSYADSMWGNTKALLSDLKAMVSNLAGIDGRKVFVLAGASMPEHPGRETAMWAVQHFQDKIKKNISPAFMEGGRSQTIALLDTARFANANGVTFYMIDAADSREESSAENPYIADYERAFLAFTNSGAAYKALADITGGSALTNTQNFDSAFQTVARDLSSFYSIGYRPAEGSAADRKVTVRLKKPGLFARTRRTYTPRSADDEINDRVIANLFHRGAQGDWPVTLTAQTPVKTEGESYKVAVAIEMAPKLTLLPQDDKLVGGFVLYIVVGTKEGAKSKVTRSARKIEIPKDAEAGFRAKPMVYNLALSVRPGDNILSIGVVDQVGSIAGFARADVIAR